MKPADRKPKGRGAGSNPDGRYESRTRAALDDGWGSLDAEAPPLRTTVAMDAARTVITYNRSPDIPFDRSINPYRGCEHGCVYCFARPTHAYLGLSPGLDFESRLFAKPDAAALLAGELRRPGYRCQPIAMGTNTDPYQPVEQRWRITRQLLELLAACRHPVSIVTKSALIERDLDLLAPMAADGLAEVFISVTTLDRALARRLEPRAAAPQRRLDTLRALSAAGIPTGVLVAPVIPALTDAELEAILQACAEAGARSAAYVLLRLPLEVKALFREWLQMHAPLKAGHVMQLLREARGGRDNDPRFGERMRGNGAYADMLRQRFRLACRRLGLNRTAIELDTGQFRPPPRDDGQMELF
ncbi:MAG: PA0069 family radical SAM protein [Pseudomonadota bacterium]|uniref:PA0069 family radical SAM protein n=1 Tax=Thermithiobacillus tepidarius TaxID=929 RepID=UPI0003FEA373|nr:PA0069 family radical SAM protein [Thermithiobacillus tepidarius]